MKVYKITTSYNWNTKTDEVTVASSEARETAYTYRLEKEFGCKKSYLKSEASLSFAAEKEKQISIYMSEIESFERRIIQYKKILKLIQNLKEEEYI